MFDICECVCLCVPLADWQAQCLHLLLAACIPGGCDLQVIWALLLADRACGPAHLQMPRVQDQTHRTKAEYRGPTQTGDAVFFTNYIFTQSLASRDLQLSPYTPAACSLDHIQHVPTEGFPTVRCTPTTSLWPHAFRHFSVVTHTQSVSLWSYLPRPLLYSYTSVNDFSGNRFSMAKPQPDF